MLPSEPKICVITLNWNGSKDTIECLDSVLALKYENFEIIVCDNDSKKDDFQQLHDWCQVPRRKPVILIPTGGNLGYAGGMNVGIRHALANCGAEYVWIINNDATLHVDALTEVVNRSVADPEIGICGSTLIYFHRREMIQALGGARYSTWRARSAAIGAFSSVADIPASPGEVENHLAYVVGAAMLVSKKLLDQVGLMDESYFLYSEEHDWAHRAALKGFHLGFAPRSHVYHKHGATIGTSSSGGSELSLFYLYRNKLLFAARHHPWTLPIALPSLVWDGLKLMLKGYPKKAFALWKGLAAAPTLGRYGG